MFCGFCESILVKNHSHYTTTKAIFLGAVERNWYALLMKANKPEIAELSLFSLLSSHGGISSCMQNAL